MVDAMVEVTMGVGLIRTRRASASPILAPVDPREGNLGQSLTRSAFPRLFRASASSSPVCELLAASAAQYLHACSCDPVVLDLSH